MERGLRWERKSSRVYEDRSLSLKERQSLFNKNHMCISQRETEGHSRQSEQKHRGVKWVGFSGVLQAVLYD